MTHQERIEELIEQIGKLSMQRVALETEGRKLALENLGLQIGDTIYVNSRAGYYPARVEGVEAWATSWARPVARRIKKDGTLARNTVGYVGSDWKRENPEAAL